MKKSIMILNVIIEWIRDFIPCQQKWIQSLQPAWPWIEWILCSSKHLIKTVNQRRKRKLTIVVKDEIGLPKTLNCLWKKLYYCFSSSSNQHITLKWEACNLYSLSFVATCQPRRDSPLNMYARIITYSLCADNSRVLTFLV